MRFIFLVPAVLCMAFASQAAEASLITLQFAGNLDSVPGPDGNIAMTLDVDSNTGAITGGFYRRPPNGSIFDVNVDSANSTITGLNSSTVSFDISLVNNAIIKFDLTSSDVLNSWGLGGWNNFGVPSAVVDAQFNNGTGNIQLISAVPEPTALLMVGSVIGLAGLRRRRK